MQEAVKKELKPRKLEEAGKGRTTAKDSANRALESTECTLEALNRRCDTQTTVLKRIMDFSLVS